MIVAGFVSFQGTFAGILIPAYIILFGIVICIMVFYIPENLYVLIPFYVSSCVIDICTTKQQRIYSLKIVQFLGQRTGIFIFWMFGTRRFR